MRPRPDLASHEFFIVRVLGLLKPTAQFCCVILYCNSISMSCFAPISMQPSDARLDAYDDRSSLWSSLFTDDILCRDPQQFFTNLRQPFVNGEIVLDIFQRMLVRRLGESLGERLVPVLYSLDFQPPSPPSHYMFCTNHATHCAVL
jgi:hypothetical protein